MTTEFTGKRLLVTGGANGLGKSIVKRFYDTGAEIFVLDCDETALKDLKLEYPKINPVIANLIDWNASRKAVEAILPLDHLVNNAGILKCSTFLETTEDVLDLSFGINFKAAFNLTQVFAKGVIEHKLNGGTIVNVSSLADSITAFGVGAYCCTKAAVTMLTKNSAQELGKHNIRVNCVRPAAMKTNLLLEFMTRPDIAATVADLSGRAALKQDLDTSEVANLVYFLSSSQSAMITGTGVAIDGGISVA